MLPVIKAFPTRQKCSEVNNQPNITRCMNILENELDCKLLIRSHKGIQLTTEGEHLFRHVAIAIEQLTYGEKEIIKNKKEQLETIEEYKKSLIYEYVTGKKEVKNA